MSVSARLNPESPGRLTYSSTFLNPDEGDASLAVYETVKPFVVEYCGDVAEDDGVTVSTNVVVSALAGIASTLPALSYARV